MMRYKGTFRTLVLASLAIGLVYQAIAQPGDPSLPDNPDPASSVSVRSDRSTDLRDATWRSFVPDFFHDQKGIWIAYPSHVARGHYWIPTLAVTGVTAGLIAADPHMMSYFRSHQKNLDAGNDVFDPMITTGMVIAVPATIMAVLVT